MKPYNHLQVEKKWQKYWENKKLFNVKENPKKKKFYALIEFPYPSGDGLHVGHIRSKTAMDIISRKRRREGFNVLYPIGWDAFGLPTENYAIKTGIQPAIVTKKNTDIFRRQLKSLGFSFDWSREINTTDPKYYKWTQWIFLQLLKNGLAYKKKMFINWCPKDLIGLANEEVIDGKCERCGTPVEKKEKEQWILAITKYAERLDKDLDKVDFLPKIKVQQRNWIGESEGAEIEFEIDGKNKKVKVFTTRPDTIFGVTYIVLSPEHQYVDEFIKDIPNKEEVEKYVKEAKAKSEIQRTDISKEKTGVELKGLKAINPANGQEIPVWIADYVLSDYGTSAVMAVPAHDNRDYDFAKKYNLPTKEVIMPERIDKRNPPVPGKQKIERRNVHVIVTDKRNGKILCLKWKKHPWTTFPMGGVEEGEDLVVSARREVEEETGYKNLINPKVLGGMVKAEYFAAHKDVNRISFTSLVTFDLGGDEKSEISEHEKAEHEAYWADPKDVNEVDMTHAEMDIWLQRIKGNMSYEGDGITINSGKFTNRNSQDVKKEITDFVKGNWVKRFKLRDWIFSRQHYWGEPIPVIHCKDCGIVPVPEKDLPVELPKVKNYKPTNDGESPLSSISKWVNVKCPKCKGQAKRETDTMPNWAGSSWYYLRYADPKNTKTFAHKSKLKYWTPVDWYNGGMEHTTLHLLYSRFWHKFLFDLKLVPSSEPYKKRTSHGLILGQGGEKMSKSRGNVVNPDGIVKSVGADSLRVYEMFMGPFGEAIAWDSQSISGSRRFIEKVWKLCEKVEKKKVKGKIIDPELDSLVHKTIKKVSLDIEEMRFNTAISAMMILANEMEKREKISKEHYEIFIQILSPFAPHIGEELWHEMGNKQSVHLSSWPKWDKRKVVDTKVNIVVQVNGKVRGTLEASPDENEDGVKNMALNMDEIKKWIGGKEIKRVVFVKGKLINLVI